MNDGKVLWKTFVFVCCILLGYPIDSHAQSCNGSLGDPIVNQTFGAGRLGALTAEQTTYKYVSTNCANDGEYTLASAVNPACFYGTWHRLTEDHTPGDKDGNMLVVNASHGAGEFYKQQVTGLCGGTTFEFSVWIVNLMSLRTPSVPCVLRQVDPNITMRIETTDGTLIKAIDTGTIERTGSAAWKRFAALFTLPSGTSSVVLRLVNNEIGGCGNDLALDDIQFRPCGPLLQASFGVGSAADTVLCSNSELVINSSLGSGYSNPSFQWQESKDGKAWTDIAGANTPVYTVNTTIPQKKYYRLVSAEAENIRNSQCRAVSTALTVTTCACVLTTYLDMYVPTVFTPNDDRVNDTFDIYVSQSVPVDLKIYNRWGSVVFATATMDQKWDGNYLDRPCPPGDYTWEVNYEITDFKNLQGRSRAAAECPLRKVTQQGHILLLR
ncbi:hypothetical protein GCM10023189_08570 [Nibrella saemangeumensis]|uniref:Gliding motility-associated C-terminal domain-containing protein n=1 Tax=Nibrella saemangeumensis TaxID=1084526 RepID=A0ABP8MEG3_9BACT